MLGLPLMAGLTLGARRGNPEWCWRSVVRVILIWTLCGDGGDGQHPRCRMTYASEVLEPALGQDFEAQVAALHGPLIVLHGQDGADQCTTSRVA